ETHEAAEKLDFEKAADLRNMLEDLRRTTKPTRRFTRHSLPSSIDPVSDVHALADALQLPRLPVVMECFDISNISTTHVVASMVCFRNGVPDKDNYRRYRIRTVEGQDDFASMAEVVRRRYSRVLLGIAETGNRKPESSEEAVALIAAGFGGVAFAATDSRRSPSLCQYLSSAPHEEAHWGKHPRRLSGSEPEPEEFAPAQIRIRESAAESDRGTNRLDGRHRTEARP